MDQVGQVPVAQPQPRQTGFQPRQTGPQPVQPRQTGFQQAKPAPTVQSRQAGPQPRQTRPPHVPSHGRIITKSGSKGFLKLLILFILVVGLTLGTGVTVSNYLAENVYRVEKGVVYVASLKNTNWQDLGVVPEPEITLPVKTLSGYVKQPFLLDSGAVISSLPRELAERTGQDLAFLPRSTFKGFGGKTSFAYRGEMNVLLGEREANLPVVFTEAEGTKSLLGRKGFWDQFSIYYNHDEKKIEIRE